jgi:uncharacterized membrane protein
VIKQLLPRWQANFWTGLAIVLPGVISVAVLVWLFGTIARITDLLLFFLPQTLTHHDQGSGPMHWYWSVVALLLAVVLIGLVGLLARNYIGKRLIKWVDTGLMQVPLLNKIYSATKQVNEAFSSNNKTAFRTVVLVPFPHPGSYTLGFITSEQHAEVQAVTSEDMVCVFVPTTPNPTGGFLLMVPEDKLTRLKMSVPDAIKYIVSLGSILPEYTPASHQPVGSGPAALVSAAHD